MDKKSRASFLTLLWLCISGVPVLCQESLSDSTILMTMRDHVTVVYREALGPNLHINQGKELVEFRGEWDKHPYFKSFDWADGSVRYDEQWYDEMPILYNTVNDEVAILSNNGLAIKLNKNRVSEFRFLGSRFVHLADPGLREKGFYEILYDGDVNVLARRKKVYLEKLTYDRILFEYLVRDYYLIQKDGKYHQVRGKHSVLGVFDDQKKVLRRQLRKEGIQYSQSRDKALVLMAEYYDELKR